MPKFNAENERLKRRYIDYLKESDGLDEKSLDKVRAALVRFEESTKYKPFKKFHIAQARQFKDALARARNIHGKPLSLSTTDATLRLVKGFFHWLAGQQGFKKVLTYSDAKYFNNNRKDARAAHATRPAQVPTSKATYHAFQAMANVSDVQRRDKAMFACLMITGARAGAIASFKLKHVNLTDGYVFQDGREVNTKASKTFTTWFFPMHPEYLECFTAWVEYLRNEKLFGPEDALFPKPVRKLVEGKFNFEALSREPYANTSQVNAMFRNAFAQVQLPQYSPHSVRKVLVNELSERELPLATQKAWSQNLGHENFTTTVSSYLPVPYDRQGELMRGMKNV